MSNKQLINDAFSDIDEALIASAAQAPQGKRVSWQRWTAVAVCVAILLSFCMVWIIQLIDQDGPISENGWIVVSSDKTSVRKNKNGLGGLQYTLCISYTPLQISYGDLLGIKPEQDVCAEMLGQWLLSAATCDYSQHFPLFSDEILRDRIYPAFEKEGYEIQDAYEKMATVVADTVGFTHCRVEYAVKNVENTEETLQAFKDEWKQYFEQVGIATDDITQVCKYTIEDIKIYYNDLFLIEFSSPMIVFYQIGGIWYASPEMLDDDLSIDLLQSDPGERNGFYKIKHTAGVVARIENEYVVLEDTSYYLLRSEEVKVSVGDSVEIAYYSVGLEGCRVTDGVCCNLGVIASIAKPDAPSQ